MLVVEDVERVGRLWVIVFDVVYVLLIAELAPAHPLLQLAFNPS